MRNTLLTIGLALFLNACASTQAIRPAAELPRSTPWDLRALSRPPQFQWVDSTGPVRSLMYKGLPHQGKPTSVFAYYATPGTLAGDPSKDKSLPAVVLIHGGGGTAFREWVELWAKRGYAAISMDLAGSRPVEGQNAHDRKNRTRLPDGGPGQDHVEKFDTIATDDLTDDWCYHAPANAILAHSPIRSFPGADANRTAVTGISWGGYLTCIVASVDNRFKAAVPVYGCGFLHENSAWLGEFEKLGPEKAKKWVELYDPSRYLPACRVPILFVNGTNDFAYPLDSYMKSYHAVKHAPKNIRITVNMPHGHPSGWEPQEIGLFVDERLLGGQPLPRVTGVEHSNGKLRIRLGGASHVTSMSLHSASGPEAVNKHQWQSTVLDEDHIARVATSGKDADAAATLEADLPSLEAGLWLLTVTDDRGAIVSSEVVIK